jgi:hypothetical protein
MGCGVMTNSTVLPFDPIDEEPRCQGAVNAKIKLEWVVRITRIAEFLNFSLPETRQLSCIHTDILDFLIGCELEILSSHTLISNFYPIKQILNV